MAKSRGKKHTTLTETAKQVTRVVEKVKGVKMVAPGEIKQTQRSTGQRYIKIVYTNAGCELSITGQGNQKVSVHTDKPELLLPALSKHKSLRHFTISEDERKPEV
jgi:hypothetical protein